jgi:CHAT domain-containing protein/tetratricopeptide (TPR) repeat protein
MTAAALVVLALGATGDSGAAACERIEQRAVLARSIPITQEPVPVVRFRAERSGAYVLTFDRLDADLEVTAGASPGERFTSPVRSEGTDRLVVRTTAGQEMQIDLHNRSRDGRPGKVDLLVSHGSTESLAARRYLEALTDLTDAQRLLAANLRALAAAAARVSSAANDPPASSRGVDKVDWRSTKDRFERASTRLAQLRDEPDLCAPARTLVRRAAVDATLALAAVAYSYEGDWEASEARAAEAAAAYRDLNLDSLATRAEMLRATSLIDGAIGARRSDQREGLAAAGKMFGEARELLAAARNFYRARSRKYDEAFAENNIGLAHYYQGHWGQAERHYSAALAVYGSLGSRFGRLLVDQNLAVLAVESGRYEEAAAAYSGLKQRWAELDDPDNLAATLENGAISRIATGDIDSATADFLEALRIRRSQGDEVGTVRALRGLGQAALAGGDTRLARSYLETAWQLIARDPSKSRRAWISTGLQLAEVRGRLGNPEEASAMLEELRKGAITPMHRFQIARQRGRLAALQEDWRAAARHFEEALLIPITRDHPALMTTRLEHVRALVESGALTEAASRLSGDLRPATGLAAAEQAYLEALISYRRGERSDALRQVDDAIAKSVRLRLTSAAPESRSRLSASRRDQCELKIRLLLDRVAEAKSGGAIREADRWTWEALAVSEDARSRSLEELIVRSRRSAPAGVPDELEKRESLYSQLDQRMTRLEAIADRPTAYETEIERLRLEALELEAAIRSLEAQIWRGELRPGSARTIGAPALRTKLRGLPADTAVIEFFAGRSAIWAWTFHGDQLSVAQVVDGSRATSLLRSETRKLVSQASTPALLADLRRLRAAFAPVLQRVASADRLIVVPDAELHYLPFAFLAATELPGDRFEPRVEVTLAPAVSLMESGSKGERPSASDKPSLLLVSDPVFSATDSRVTAARGPRPLPAAAGEISPSMGRELARLPGTAREAAAIGGLAGAFRIRELSGFEANRANVIDAANARYDIAHFATHAVLRAQAPRLSFLALSMVDRAGVSIPGQLYASDVGMSGLRARLVVLSACQSLAGEDVHGEGPLGLPYAFLGNGSEAVISTLWEVPDAFAVELMKEFYDGLLTGRLPAGSALRRAQATMARNVRWNSPAYWGTFTVTVRTH